MMAHDRKLVIGGVDLVQVCLKNVGPTMVSVTDKVEKLFIESDFFSNAPFSWISLIIRHGLQNKFAPVYQRINKKYGDLPISIEVDTHELIGATPDTVKTIYERATLDALIHVAHKYDLSARVLEECREALTK